MMTRDMGARSQALAAQRTGGRMRRVHAMLVSLVLGLAVPSDAWAEPTPAPAECPPPHTGEVDATTGPVDLNSADEQALLGLPGIGPARAQAILAYRAAHGGFRSVSQLLQIRGIGRALLKQLRPLVTLRVPAR